METTIPALPREEEPADNDPSRRSDATFHAVQATQAKRTTEVETPELRGRSKEWAHVLMHFCRRNGLRASGGAQRFLTCQEVWDGRIPFYDMLILRPCHDHTGKKHHVTEYIVRIVREAHSPMYAVSGSQAEAVREYVYVFYPEAAGVLNASRTMREPPQARDYLNRSLTRHFNRLLNLRQVR